jgi:hypothetical protein
MAEDSRPSIVRNQEWDSTTTKLHALDLAELVLGLVGRDPVDGEAALRVVDEAEVLVRLLDRNDVHEPCGVSHVGANLVVDLDEALHHDGLGFAAVENQWLVLALLDRGVGVVILVESVLQPVADEDDEREAFPDLMRTGTGFLQVGQNRNSCPIRPSRDGIDLTGA